MTIGIKPDAGGTFATIDMGGVTVAQFNSDKTLTAFMPLGFQNLKLSATGTNASVTVTADSVAVVHAASGMTRLARAINQPLNTAIVGAGGLDTGPLAVSTWYAVFLIVKDDGTQSTLCSLSATAPTLPSGYTHFARIGWIITDGVNAYPSSFLQYGRTVSYKVAAGSNITAIPRMILGSSGSISTPTWTPVAVASFVPPTASRIIGVLAYQSSAAQGTVIAAPNASYGPAGSTTNPPPVVAAGSSETAVTPFNFVIESSNLYYASNSAAGCMFCCGWEDNL